MTDKPQTQPRFLAVAQNPWPIADKLIRYGCEVRDSDFAPDDGRVYIFDLELLRSTGAQGPAA